MSVIRQCPCCLSKNTMSGLRYSMTWSAWVVPQQLSVVRLHNSLWEVLIPFIRVGYVSAFISLGLRYGCVTVALRLTLFHKRVGAMRSYISLVVNYLSCHPSHSLLRFSIAFPLQAVVYSKGRDRGMFPFNNLVVKLSLDRFVNFLPSRRIE